MAQETATSLKKENEDKGASAATNSPNLPKTTGEKWFGRFRFAIGEVFILTLTAIFAVAARHGKEGQPFYKNPFKWTQDKVTKSLGDAGLNKGLAAAFGSMLATSWGGNLFAFVMKPMGDNKERIVTHINERHGKPGEVEAGKENVSREPKESWADVVKARLTAMGTVLVSFMGAEALFRKHKSFKDAEGNKLSKFNAAEEWIGRKFAGFFGKEGKEIAKLKLDKSLTGEQLKNKPYQYGRVLALDVFATTASLAIWLAISKLLARHRKKKVDGLEPQDNASSPIPAVTKVQSTTATAEDAAQDNPETSSRFASKVRNQPSEGYRAHVEAEKTQQSETQLAAV